MESYVVLASFTDRQKANAACSALEKADIPVILEHVEIAERENHASMVRVLVPLEHVQRAAVTLKAQRCLVEDQLLKHAVNG